MPHLFFFFYLPPAGHRFDNETPVEEMVRTQANYTVIAHNNPISPSPRLGQMQALHDVVQKGWVRYIGMSSCYAWQCMRPLHQPAYPSALIRPSLNQSI